jgi:type I restriction enzyme S subunit
MTLALKDMDVMEVGITPETGDSPPDLPPGWRWARLGDVCERKTGTRDPRREPGGTFTYVDITSVDNRLKRVVDP